MPGNLIKSRVFGIYWHFEIGKIYDTNTFHLPLHIANDLLLFIFIRVVHSGLPFVIQNGDNQGICKKRHGRRNLRYCKCYYIC